MCFAYVGSRSTLPKQIALISFRTLYMFKLLHLFILDQA